MFNIGTALGIIIGILSGAMFIFLLKTMAKEKIGVKEISIMSGEIVLIASFIFGGSWLNTELLEVVNISEIFESYINSLLFTFIVISLLPLFRFIVRTGNDIKVGG